METTASFHDWPFRLPPDFYDQIIHDISISTWVRLIQKNPILRRGVLEGFTDQSQKLTRLISQPHFGARMRRTLQNDSSLLEGILKVWAEEQLPTVAFLEMLDPGFVKENWRHLKDIVGPSRFLAAVRVLGVLQEEFAGEATLDEYWKRPVGPETIEPLLPLLTLWKDFSSRFPEVITWASSSISPFETEKKGSVAKQPNKVDRQDIRGAEARQRRLEKKLSSLREEEATLQEQLTRYRKENENLREKLSHWEHSFERKLQDSLAHQRAEWYRKYQSVDLASLDLANQDLESLLKRAERALDLQRQADEKYGIASAVRQKLLKTELYLKEIERIYADSLFVHNELARVKEALLREKRRLLELPGIEKVIEREPSLTLSEDLRQRIRLLEPEAASLPLLNQLEALLNHLSELGVLEEKRVRDEIDHKKRQIFEGLYASSRKPARSGLPADRFQTLDDFVGGGESRKYDLYIDGYNVLLRTHGRETQLSSSRSITRMREEFIQAVYGKSSHFRKVYLVFDGIEDSKDRRGNLEIVYADKTRGTNADVVLIQALRRRKDKQTILVTADQEIIEATTDWVFALIDPSDFLWFAFGARTPSVQG